MRHFWAFGHRGPRHTLFKVSDAWPQISVIIWAKFIFRRSTKQGHQIFFIIRIYF